MKRAQLNILILAIYLVLAVALLGSTVMLGAQMIAAEKDVEIPDTDDKFSAYDILIGDEISLYVGQETVIVPYLMSVDGTIKNTRFEYSSSTEAIKVDNLGNISVLSDPEGEAYITITDQKTGTTKTVKVNVVSSLSSVLGILDASGHLIQNGSNHTFTTGKAVELTVNTEPKGLSVEGLYTVKITDSKGTEKQAFQVSGKHNKITLNPVGIGAGKIKIVISSPEGEILNTTEFGFNINMENKSLSDEILDRSGMTLMVGRDFDSITTLTIDDSITDMNTLSILTNLRTVYIESSRVMTLKNLKSSVIYKVPVNLFLNYCQSDSWKDYVYSILPYNTSNENDIYVVYHDENNGNISYDIINSSLSFPQYSEINGQKHTGWLNTKGEAVSTASIKMAKDSLHIKAQWTSVYCTIVYHVRLYGDEYTEVWTYDASKGLKDITTFPNYVPKNGYQFLGWTTSTTSNPTAYDVNYAPNQPFTDIPATDGLTIHLYDVWEAFEYYIRLTAPDGFSFSGDMSDILVRGESYVLPELVIYDQGYIFSGWEFVDKNGKTITLEAGENNTALATEDGEIVVLTAKIGQYRYMISFSCDGAFMLDKDGDEVANGCSISFNYHDSYDVPIPWTNDGKEFLYWKDNKGNIYYPGSKIHQLAFSEDGSPVRLVFTAYWE